MSDADLTDHERAVVDAVRNIALATFRFVEAGETFGTLEPRYMSHVVKVSESIDHLLARIRRDPVIQSIKEKIAHDGTGAPTT